MIVVTGGAGFIGSVLVWELNQRGCNDILIVDRLGKTEKWKNLAGLSFEEYCDKDEFIRRLESGFYDRGVEMIFHLGACSSTMQTDADYLIENNYHYSVRLGMWWEKHPQVRFMYASSAATYGDGGRGYVDDESALHTLRPLNMYGYSKHLFDLHARRREWLSRMAGLKYFNVFGPNEYHKEEMRSLICKAYPQVAQTGKMSLYQSHRPDFRDGEQVRDFIYVKDAVAMTLFFADHRDVHGIYNIGTGKARSWNDLARALFAASGKKEHITYVPMPEAIRSKYQYATQADCTKLRAAGCSYSCGSLEDSVRDYVVQYLSKNASISEKIDRSNP